MKKAAIIIILTIIIACNEKSSVNSTAKDNSVLWASNVETLLPMVQDTLWSKENWDEVYKYDKKAIFETMKNAVLSGKLKSFTMYPNGELTPDDFKNRITTISADDIVQMRFDEKMELDTVNLILNKKVSFVSFNIYMRDPDSQEIIGLKKLFDVKLNDTPKAIKE